MRGGAELSAMAEMRPGAREREGEEMGSARKLTADPTAGSASSGKARCSRNVAGDLGWLTKKMTVVTSVQGRPS